MFGYNLRVYCCVLKCQLLLPLLRQMNPVHTIPYCLFAIHFNIIPSGVRSSKWSLFSRCLYHEGLSGLLGLLNLQGWRHHDPINIRKHSPETVSHSRRPRSWNVRWYIQRCGLIARFIHVKFVADRVLLGQVIPTSYLLSVWYPFINQVWYNRSQY
jgi:hypothetical protein